MKLLIFATVVNVLWSIAIWGNVFVLKVKQDGRIVFYFWLNVFWSAYLATVWFT